MTLEMSCPHLDGNVYLWVTAGYNISHRVKTDSVYSEMGGYVGSRGREKAQSGQYEEGMALWEGT